jgi:hypothetical protein
MKGKEYDGTEDEGWKGPRMKKKGGFEKEDKTGWERLWRTSRTRLKGEKGRKEGGGEGKEGWGNGKGTVTDLLDEGVERKDYKNRERKKRRRERRWKGVHCKVMLLNHLFRT